MSERVFMQHGRPYPYSRVEEAKWLDNRAVAEGIIRQLGSDFSDENSVWIAEWTSPKLMRDFEMVREFHEDSITYELMAMDVTGEVEYIGFDTTSTSMSLTTGEDGHQQIYSTDEKPETCRELERKLSKYLSTATIDRNKLPRNPIWDELFENVAIELALEDSVVLNYFKNSHYFTRLRAEQNFRQFLHKWFGLSDGGIQRLHDMYQERQLPRGNSGN